MTVAAGLVLCALALGIAFGRVFGHLVLVGLDIRERRRS